MSNEGGQAGRGGSTPHPGPLPGRGGEGDDKKEPIPAVVEYRLGGEDWRVERFDLLAAEFEVKPGELPKFHALAQSSARVWLIVRRLYGMQPVVLPMSAGVDEYGVLAAPVLCEQLVLTKEELRQQLTALKGLWAAQNQPEEITTSLSPEVAAQGEMLDEDVVLQNAGYSESMFQVEGRNQKDSSAERAWFIQMVRRWKRMLENPLTGELARLALQEMLFLRRFEGEILKQLPGTTQYKELTGAKDALAKRFQERLETLNELNPWLETISQAEQARGMLSDFIRGYQEYQSKGSNQLLMGLATALEVEVECRRCVQVPDPQLRGSLILLVQSARANLWDPKWKFNIPDRLIARFDRAFTAALNVALDEEGAPKIDLMSDDPVAGEYPELESFPEGKN